MSKIMDMIAEMYPEAMKMDGDGYDDCIVGVGYRCTMQPVIVYDTAKVVAVLMERDGMDEDEAQEFHDFNQAGAWVGEGTPIFLDRLGIEQEDAVDGEGEGEGDDKGETTAQDQSTAGG